MIGLKADAYQINTNGNGQYEFFTDISTRTLLSVRVGENAGKISRGDGNVFVGYESGKENTSGSLGVFIGFHAGALNQYGNENVFVGAYSGKYNQRGDRNTFVGYQSGELNKDGSDCTAVGVAAMRENTTGNKNVAVGTRAGERILDGDNNTMVGMESGQDIRSGNNNTMAGYRSGRASFRGNENTYFGAFAGYSNSFGDGNAFIGYRSGEYLGYGNYNVAVGAFSLQYALFGSCNIAIGAFSGSTATGSGNVFVGTGAGTSNLTGNNSTYVGQNVGFHAQGDDNVYIGSKSAYAILGNKNVVIGVEAVPQSNLSGSVVIGYRSAFETFRNGVSNVFIGSGADSHLPNSSYSIAIGSRSTLTNSYSISIGEEIDNSGLNSVLIGNDLRSDANQCVSVGKMIDVASVNVFNDPLNYRFPVNGTAGYQRFYIVEGYCNTLYLNGVSNEIAKASVNTSNIYDSGCNVLKGITISDDRNNRALFNYNILYQGDTVFIDRNYNLLSYSISNTVLNERVITDGFNRYSLQVNTQGSDTITANDIAEAMRSFLLIGSNVPNIYNTNTTISSNLIPYVITNPAVPFRFDTTIPKRNRLYTIPTDATINTTVHPYRWTGINSPVSFSVADDIATSLESIVGDDITIDDISNPSISYHRRWGVYQEPTYGYLNKTIYGSTNKITDPVVYSLYPEASFATTDSFQMSVINQVKVRSMTDSNVYGILPEGSSIKTQTVSLNYPSPVYPIMSSNIHLHPSQPTPIDRSYLNFFPYSSAPLSSNITIFTMNNMLVSHQGNTYNDSTFGDFAISYQEFSTTTTPFTVQISNPNNPTRFALRFLDRIYEYRCIYHPNLATNNTCNLTLTLSPFQINQPIDIPISRTSGSYTYTNISVYEYPTYGTIHVPSYPSLLQYIPRTLNFGEDQCKILYQSATGLQDVLATVKIGFASNYQALEMYKLQEPITITPPVITHTGLGVRTIGSNLLLTTFTCNIAVIDPPFGSVRNDTFTYVVPYTYPYLTSQGGYVYTCNIVDSYLYFVSDRDTIDANKTKFGLSYIPYPYEVPPPSSNTGIDFILYDASSKISTRTAKWDYSINGAGAFTTTNTYIDYSYYRSNSLPTNRYYLLFHNITRESVYKEGSNIDIYASNVFESQVQYNDQYGHVIYSSNEAYTAPSVFTSNYLLLDDTPTPLSYIYEHPIKTILVNASNIPTIQLKNTSIYHKDSEYRIVEPTHPNLVFLQKGIGQVLSFHQSNIDREEIHLWNRIPSSQMASSLVRSNIYFEGGHTLSVNYLKYEGTTVPSLTSSTPENQSRVATYLNRVPVYPLYLPYDESFGSNGRFLIQHTSNISFRIQGNATLGCSSNEVYTSNLFSVASKGYSNIGFVDYVLYNSNLQKTSRPIRHTVFSTYQTSEPFYKNIGIQRENRHLLTSNYLYYQLGSCNILYELTTLGTLGEMYLDESPMGIGSTFTQADINHSRISFHGYNVLTTDQFGYKIKENGGAGAVILANQTIQVQTFQRNEYLSIEAGSNTSNILLQLRDTYQHQLRGDLWNQLRDNTSYNPDIRHTEMYIFRNPSKGFLYSSNQFLENPNRCNVMTSSTYERLTNPNERVYYIPYEPMSLSNDSFQFFFSYSNVVSPIYTISLKNYWSRWKDIVIHAHNEEFSHGTAYLSNIESFDTSRLPLSFGMQEDGLRWSPTTITTRGFSNAFEDITSNVRLSLSLEGSTVSVISPLLITTWTQRKNVLTSTVAKDVDNGNYFYMNYLFDCVSNSNERGLFYITKNPQNGVILKKTQRGIESSPYFTFQDITDRKVFYQHYGLTINSPITETDNFRVKVASCPYDISKEEITTNITVREAPVLTSNLFDYIYSYSNSVGSNLYRSLDATRLNLSKGFLNVYNTSNIEVVKKVGTEYIATNIIQKEDLDGGLIYYRPSSHLFETSGINKNENMVMRFTANSSTDIVEPSPLYIYPLYQDRFSQEWYSRYNIYESKNTRLYDISSNQSITYRRFVNTTSNISFENKKCTIQYEFLPYQPPLTLDTTNSSFHQTYLDTIHTYHYTFELLNTSNERMLYIDFYHSNITVDVGGQKVTITPENAQESSLFSFGNQWKLMELINYDDLNNFNLSLYLNGVNYLDGLSVPTMSFTTLKEIRINVPIYDKNNFYDYQLTREISPQTNLYYNLENFTTQMRYRNFNIFLSTYEIDQLATDTSIYNVVIGNQLNLKGLNNICVGKNFLTTGEGSIIMGSDIGINSAGSAISLNEIFNSIVISNGSFINSKVRDTIAIGNEILNDLTINIDDFLAKKPVLIGNNITQSKIDFHINFQNTFLKTTVGSPQIYCGLEGENVCMGYTTNMRFNNNGYLLHVNGGIEYSGARRERSGSMEQIHQMFGNILFTSGTTHTIDIPVVWDNIQTTDLYAFAIHGKVRCMYDDSSFGYKRVELWITPRNDLFLNRPSILSSFDSSTQLNGIVSGLSISAVRRNETSVFLRCILDTTIGMTSTNPLLVSIEVEPMYPIVLGNMVLQSPVYSSV